MKNIKNYPIVSEKIVLLYVGFLGSKVLNNFLESKGSFPVGDFFRSPQVTISSSDMSFIQNLLETLFVYIPLRSTLKKNLNALIHLTCIYFNKNSKML